MNKKGQSENITGSKQVAQKILTIITKKTELETIEAYQLIPCVNTKTITL